jgi:sugar-specific transcriptional regulator TrmB
VKLQAMDACEFLGRTQVYSAADVDALLTRIREAVEAERDATLRYFLSRAKNRAPAFLAAERACDALDALLSGEG